MAPRRPLQADLFRTDRTRRRAIRTAWIQPFAVLVYVAHYVGGMLLLVILANRLLVASIGVLGVVMVGLPFAIGVAVRRVRLARARAVWYRLCPACGRELIADKASGQCPGCEKPYSPESLVRAWERTDAKAARTKRWRPLSARGMWSPALVTGFLPAAVGLLLALALVWLAIVPRTAAPLALVVAGPMVSVLGPRVLRRDRRDYEAIERGDFRTCPECLASLPQLSDGEPACACCASCGQEFSRAWLEETWKLVYAHVGPRQGMGQWRPDRGARRMSIIFGASMLGVLALVALLRPFVQFSGLPRGVQVVFVVLLGVGTLVFIGLIASRSGYHHTRMVRLRAHGYRFCPECGYDLRDSAETGECSECGVAYSPVSLRERWEGEPRAEPPKL